MSVLHIMILREKKFQAPTVTVEKEKICVKNSVPWRNVHGRNVIWIFRPRNFVMKRPWDKTFLGTKQSLDKTSSANLQQNVPIFTDET
jgi:hypothetical protein